MGEVQDLAHKIPLYTRRLVRKHNLERLAAKAEETEAEAKMMRRHEYSGRAFDRMLDGVGE